jgi:hypothetical protein
LGNSKIASKHLRGRRKTASFTASILWKTSAILLFSLTALALPPKDKDGVQYGAGLIVNVPFPESEVAQVVQDVVQNGIIRGTKEYNKDQYITDANPATSSRVFPEWTEGGKVFYKVRMKAIDPRNFKDSGDVGTLVVRYVVQSQGDKNTVLRIDARFEEDFRHVTHLSNGSVESAEYTDIHDHLEAIETMRSETVEAEKEKQELLARGQSAASSAPPATVPQPVSVNSATTDAPLTSSASSAGLPSQDSPSSALTLEQRVQDLRRQVQRLVKAPGAPLKSGPFHSASTLQSLPAGTEVLVVISTTYWLGVETHEGQHGWILRDELELLP